MKLLMMKSWIVLSILFATRLLVCGASDASQPKSKEDTAFSACLLVKDDNALIPEWVAYHYQTLPLRHLVVAVDPSSVTSPKSVLDVWTTLMPDLDVEVWGDRDYREPDEFVSSVERRLRAAQENDDEELIQLHRQRQKTFINRCLRHHQNHGRSWVALVDTDEYIAFNHRFKDNQDIDHRGTILSFLNEKHRDADEPCVSMTRTLFGPKALPPKEKQRLLETVPFPRDFDSYKLSTVNYYYHDSMDSDRLAGYAKVMINVDRLPNFLFKDDSEDNIIYSVHQPLPEFCARADTYFSSENDAESPFRVHHYLGSWERYNSKVDVRRSTEVFSLKADAASKFGPLYSIVPSWLNHFVNAVGRKKALELLKPMEEERLVLKSAASTTMTCGLLFFGLARNFSVVHPSIKNKVLRANPGCDVFVHTYNVSVSIEGNSTIPMETGQIEPFLATATASISETEESFVSAHNVEDFHQYFPLDAIAWTI